MTKKITLAIVLLTLGTLVQAQEYWIAPDEFFLQPREKLVINVQKGDDFIGESVDLKKDQIENLALHELSMSLNLIDSMTEGDHDNLNYTATKEGTFLLAMQSRPLIRKWEAAEFNVALKEQGLDDVLEQRKKTNALSAPGIERYAWYTKLFFQVGEKKEEVNKKVIGFPVEIIPDKNPYTFKLGDAVRFKILFDGRPVFGVRVKIWSRFDNRTTIQNIYTEKDGTFEARISNPGSWMISVLNMVPSKQQGADWQCYRASLVFGVQK